jgi:hypothetical protein
MKKLIFRAVIVVAALSAVPGAAVLAKKPCGPCPLNCTEVTCDDGRTYCNACLAACAGAHHCQ